MDIANFFLGRQGEDQKKLKQLRGAGPAPSARESHSCTWLGSQLYIFGGYDGSRVLNDLYAYDINNAMWRQIVHSGISPPARAGHSGTALGVPPHLVIFGGANASRRFNDVSILDTVNNQWDKPTTRGRQPEPRYFHAAGLHRNNLIVFGGNEGTSSLGDLHALNTENWTWSQPVATGAPPSARTGHSGTMVNRLFFVIGGVGDAPNNTFNTHELSDMFILDCEAMAWWRPDVSPALPPIAYHAAGLVADKIFIFGGATRETLYNDVIMIDTATNVWQVVMDGETGGLPKRRRHAVARGSGTRLLFFGGWDGTQTTRCNPGVNPGCNPVRPGCNPMHPGCNPVHPACNPMHPGCNPMYSRRTDHGLALRARLDQLAADGRCGARGVRVGQWGQWGARQGGYDGDGRGGQQGRIDAGGEYRRRRRVGLRRRWRRRPRPRWRRWRGESR